MNPDLRYATTQDGVTVAYASVGSGPALIWMPSVPLSNIVGQWRVPLLSRVYSRLAGRLRLVLYDGRGTGQSERDVTDFSLDAMLRDLDAVVRHAGLPRFALFGYYHSVPYGIAYAARHPERVSHLLLFGATARGLDAMSPPQTQALLTLIERDWQLFTETAAHAWMGWSAGEDGRLVAEAFQTATTPTIAAATMRASRDVDVSAELASVAAPTLVLHRQGNEQMPLEASQRLAEALPGGRLIALAGSAPALFLEDEEGDLSVILDFLTDATAPAPRQAAGTEGLTRREAEVLVLIAQGQSNGEIAVHLGISVHTVERHAANLYRKIGARGRSDATAYAVRRGMA